MYVCMYSCLYAFYCASVEAEEKGLASAQREEDAMTEKAAIDRKGGAEDGRSQAYTHTYIYIYI